MQGTVSFHPVDLGFYDGLIQPLLAGEKVNPESWLTQALRVRVNAWHAARYAALFEDLMAQIEPPPAPEESTLWVKVRTRLERFDFKPPAASVILHRTVEPDLHLHGRPFLIGEGSAERVSAMVEEFRKAESGSEVEGLILEQLIRFDPELPRHIQLDDDTQLENESSYRTSLLRALKQVFEMAAAARNGDTWGRFGGDQAPASQMVGSAVPWQSLVLHSRAMPYWVGQDVDGIETICLAAGVAPPDVLVPAWRLFGASCEEFPAIREQLGTELRGEGQLGAFVAPDDVDELLQFLNGEGSRIIRAASEHGEGKTCATLLRKIRECLSYSAMHGLGYLEAGGRPILKD